MIANFFISQSDFTCKQHLAHLDAAGEVRITAPVGDGARCRNLPNDVRTIQTALNRFGPVDGGPLPRLDPDGICGPLTKGAIHRFQLKWKSELFREPAQPDSIVVSMARR